MKKRTCGTLLLAGSLLWGAVGCAALTTAAVTYQVSSDKVDVRLDEYRMIDGKESVWQDDVEVLPGDTLSKIPRITNEGIPCYLRASVTFASERETEIPLTKRQLGGMTSEWIARGDYYYYTEVLDSQKQVDLFQSISIPSEWETGKDDNNRWEVSVQVDAVQAEAFAPDFSGDDPWGTGTGSYEIIKATDDKVTALEQDQSKVRFVIEQDMEGFSVDTKELYRDLATFVPGTSRKGTITLSNTTSRERPVYLQVDTPEPSELTDALEMTISEKTAGKTTVLYQGKAGDSVMLELGKIAGKTDMELQVLLYLPKEADNALSAKEGAVRLSFSTELPAKDAQKSAASDGSGSKSSISNAVKTADTTRLLVWTGLLGIGLAAACYIGGRKLVRRMR